jgi:hypothetical protein
MAYGNRREFLLTAGLGLSTVAGCGPTITNETNPIGPPPDLSTVRKETPQERAERLKSEIKALQEAKDQQKRTSRSGPS